MSMLWQTESSVCRSVDPAGVRVQLLGDAEWRLLNALSMVQSLGNPYPAGLVLPELLAFCISLLSHFVKRGVLPRVKR